MQCDFNDGSGNIISNTKGNDYTLVGSENVNFEWLDGHVNAPITGSRGVAAPYYIANAINETFFGITMRNEWKEGGEVIPVVRWQIDNNSDLNIPAFEVEMTVTNDNDIIQNTSVSQTQSISSDDTSLIKRKKYVTCV